MDSKAFKQIFCNAKALTLVLFEHMHDALMQEKRDPSG
jgi:hypothetical protein